MTEMPKRPMFSAESIAAPLRHPVFRRIWLASLLSNLGLLIQGVGAAWAMTQMTSSADMVALVQTAVMLPVMLISMPAGAIADMYDRRIVALVVAVDLADRRRRADGAGLFRPADAVHPAGFCFVIGSGMALFGPAWQASVNEQVPPETLPPAIALNSISFNIARSFGPAIGGDRGRRRRRGRGVRRQRAAVYSAARRAVPLAAQQRAVAAAAGAAEPRHRLRRALRRPFAAHPHRADADAGDRRARRLGVGADAAGGARPACTAARRPTASCSAPSASAR